MVTLEAWIVVVTLVLGLVPVVAGRARAHLAALGIAVVLGGAQLLGLGMLDAPQHPAGAVKALYGFGQPVIFTLICLFILTHSLEVAGITGRITHWLVNGGRSERRLIAAFAGLTAFFSLFMNNLAAAALMLPIALETSRRTGIKPSKFLIPLSYGSMLGGAATYFTTANMITSDLLAATNPPQARLSVLDFTPTGGLIALAGLAFLTWLGPRLLPEREPGVAVSDGLSSDMLDRHKAAAAISITFMAIVAAIAGAPVHWAMLAGAALVLLLRIVGPAQAIRAVDWRAILLIAGMYTASLAMVNTGLARLLGEGMLRLVGPLGGLGLAAGAFLLTGLLTQAMGGQVTALVTAPAAISAAISLGVDPQAIAVATAIGCNAVFLTPLTHPVNIVVMEPGGYTFHDYFTVGLPLTVISFVCLVIGMALFWGL